MPSPSMFGKRMEVSDRTLVKVASAQQLHHHRPASPLIHRGLMFADGTPYRGGKGQVGSPAHDHEIINPSAPPPGYVEPTGFLPGGLPVILGRKHSTASGCVTPQRSTSPAASVHGSGKKHIVPPSHVSPIAHGTSPREPQRIHKVPSVGPADHVITGVCESPGAVDSRRQSPRGPKHLDGCPTWQPPPFEKRPYTPQTKRVASRPPDNDIFGVAAVVTTHVPTPAQTTPRGVRRAAAAVTPGRTPPPYAPAAGISFDNSSVRSRTPVRAQSPGSRAYNILTGQPL